MFKQLELERDQIWAEAVYWFKQGEALYLEGDVLKEAEKEQASRLIIDPWESIIQDYIDRPIPKDWFDRTAEAQKNYWIFNSEEETDLVERDRICTSEVLTVCLGIEPKRQTSIDRKRVIDILRKSRTYSYRRNVKFGRNNSVTSGFIRV